MRAPFRCLTHPVPDVGGKKAKLSQRQHLSWFPQRSLSSTTVTGRKTEESEQPGVLSSALES